jgi:hypothetical protein
MFQAVDKQMAGAWSESNPGRGVEQRGFRLEHLFREMKFLGR